MQGQTSYQISGDEQEEEKSTFSDEDLQVVMEKTGASKEKAKKALEESNGDIASAIMELK
jgi:nascent polypeptide-associated complex subunit alpha